MPKDKRAPVRKRTLDDPGPYCSFCGKSRGEVRCLVAGPNVHMCDECIGTSVDLVYEEIGKDPSAVLPVSSLILLREKRLSEALQELSRLITTERERQISLESLENQLKGLAAIFRDINAARTKQKNEA